MAVAAFSFGRNWVKSLVILITQVSALGYAGICVGLCRYLHWAMQVYALSYASICNEGCSRLRGALEVMWRDNVTIYNIKTRGNGN